jgi:hypothetical protein
MWSNELITAVDSFGIRKYFAQKDSHCRNTDQYFPSGSVFDGFDDA